MADTREVKIVLETVDGSAGGTSSETERADTQVAQQNEKTGNKSAMKVGIAMASQLGAVALNETTAWLTYNINKEFNLNDDYIGQRNLTIATQAVSWGVSSASTVISMAATGATIGGPWGAAIGAVMGVGTVIAQTTRANTQAMDQQQIRINQMNAQLDFTRQRSGWSLKAASIGENL